MNASSLVARLGRTSRLVVTVVLIIGVGMVWLLVDVVADSDPSTSGDVYERIDAYVDDQLDDSRIPGAAVAIVADGVTVHATGYGTDGHGNQATADTPFWIGSNTKSITALAIMQLVEDDLIDLDAPVQQYLPDFELADPDAASTITVRHLINQTSGIARIDGIRAVANGRDQTMSDTVADMADLDLNRQVGESFEYANLNSVVLGAIIEAVTAQSWQDYVDEHIFEPSAMDTTFTDHDLAEAAGLTATHRSFFGFPIQTDGQHLDALVAAGYVYSTANDMARYLAMYGNHGTLDGNRLLSANGIDEMLSPATNERTFPLQSETFTAAYGAGWFVGPFGAAADARWHQGSLPHFTAWMVLLPDTDEAVVVLLNEGNQFEIGGANAAWSRIPQGIVNLLRDEAPPTGTGSARFFIVFTTLAAAIVAAQIIRLARLIRNGVDPKRPTRRGAVPLIWEIGVAGLVLVTYPVVISGLGWSTAFSFVPDLTLTVVLIGGLGVISGAVRAALLIQRRRAGTPRANTPNEPAHPRADAAATPARIDELTGATR
jgi:CubicO group peptidase (beta-lactamase class C family)